jgi:hypothetical protein
MLISTVSILQNLILEKYFFNTAPIAVREVQKSDRSKKKLAKVAEADGEDEDGEDIDIKDEGEIGGDRCNVRCEGDGE